MATYHRIGSLLFSVQFCVRLHFYRSKSSCLSVHGHIHTTYVRKHSQFISFETVANSFTLSSSTILSDCNPSKQSRPSADCVMKWQTARSRVPTPWSSYRHQMQRNRFCVPLLRVRHTQCHGEISHAPPAPFGSHRFVYD